MIIESLDRTKTEWTGTVLQLPRPRSWCELGIIVTVFHYLRCATLTSAFLQPLSQRSFNRKILYSTTIQNAHNPVQDDGRSKTFLQWMYDVKDCQGDIDAVQLLTKNGCRGLYAAQDIDQGDYIFAVPFTSPLLIENEETSVVERGYKFLQLEQELKQHPDYTHEWKPYLDVLPSRSNSVLFDATPDFWSHGQIEKLELRLCIDQILEKKKSIETMAIKGGVDVSDLQFAT
ncbi:hypothetical protein IV203_011722 [Nitzschia inconspicua]|uniref:Uncharacterized protein n=1 Tax=Nitzschia inconspicua TaxID=303405 RepID=A0A9K3KTY8_9STRA|nr:hypothetical protein IV203_011722 [Nitzschia inconspicua]